jgi:hypothetical protein
MNYSVAPNGGITASIGQATGQKTEYYNRPKGRELTLYPPLEGLSAFGKSCIG